MVLKRGSFTQQVFTMHLQHQALLVQEHGIYLSKGSRPWTGGAWVSKVKGWIWSQCDLGVHFKDATTLRKAMVWLLRNRIHNYNPEGRARTTKIKNLVLYKKERSNFYQAQPASMKLHKITGHTKGAAHRGSGLWLGGSNVGERILGSKARTVSWEKQGKQKQKVLKKKKSHGVPPPPLSTYLWTDVIWPRKS